MESRFISNFLAEHFVDCVSDALSFLRAHPDWPTPKLNAEYSSAFLSFGEHIAQHLSVIK